MLNRIEMLEGRTLFAAVPIPSNLANDYAAVVAADAAVKVDVANLVASIKAQLAPVTADLKALPKAKTFTTDLKELNRGGSELEALVRSRAAKYLAKAAGTFTRRSWAQAAYDAKPSAANLRKQTAANTAGSKVQAQVEALESEFSDAADTQNVPGTIDPGDPSTAKLNADLQTAQTGLTTAFGVAIPDLTTANFADGTLIGVQYA